MSGEADALITDPPYNVSYTGETSESLTIQNDDLQKEDFIKLLTDSFKNADNHLKCGGAFYVWHASRTQKQFEDAIPWEIRQQLIWNKNSLVLGRQDYQWKHEPCFYGWKDGASHYFTNDRTHTTVIDCNRPQRNGEHPTMKPVELFARLIENSSRKGEIILDTFGGSGTTVIAAEQTGRTAYTMELDERYCDVIKNRWESLTGEKAVLIDG